MPQVTVSSGGPFHAYHLVRGVQRAGYLRRFITGIFNHKDAPDIDRSRVKQIIPPELAGMAIQMLPGASSIYFSYFIRDNWFDLAARRFIDGGDILDVFNHFGLYSMRKARQIGMKTIVQRSSAHPVYHHQVLSEEYERFGLKLSGVSQILFKKHVQEYVEADLIVVPSDFVWQSMAAHGVPEHKLRRVHFGFAPERFHPQPDENANRTFRVLFVGSVSLQKGVQYLLEAFKQLSLPDAELVFVGGQFPDSRAFLPAYEGLYRHIPFVPQHRLVELYHSASVFVLPSLQDGFGMVVYEAAACGLPVIISENVGAPIRDGRDGYIVPIRDSDALADRLLCLYQNPTLRREMGLSARAYVEQFTWDRYHQQVISLYDELLST
jgi:glycosyltransferase involved in cell wall biosynthesis